MEIEPARRRQRRRFQVAAWGAGVGALLALWLPDVAAAERPGLRLAYVRGAGALGCPDELALRESVAARLGYDPFRASAQGSVTATLTGGPRGLRAVVELRDASGRVTGSRLLTTAQRDCRELSAAMALAICIAVDPFVLTRSPPGSAAPLAVMPPPIALAPPAASVPSVPPAPCPLCPACPPPPPSPVSFRVGAGVQVDVGAVPTIGSLGVVAQAALHYRAFILGLEGRLDPYLGSRSSPGVASPGGVGATLLLALLQPCARAGPLGFCALLGMGALQGQGVGVATPSRETTFYAAAGARIALAVPLRPRLALALHLDGLAPLTRTSLKLDGVEVWTTPAFSGALGASLQVLFP